MYKVQIDISTWGAENETVTIETSDFAKVRAIQKFIEMQQENDWTADYVQVDEGFDDEEADDEEVEYEEVEEDEPVTVSTYVITKLEN